MIAPVRSPGALARKLRATVGLAWAGLRHERLRTTIGICGIAVAVLSMTLLAGGGLGVLTVGEQQFEAADRDLWVTGGPLGITTAGGGGFENSIHGAHEVAAEMEGHEDVRTAAPMAFETVYVSPNGSSFDTVIGSGVPGGGGSISLAEGDGFTTGDRHYAGGSYDGPRANEVVVDRRTAEAYDLEVGDTLYVGGTLSTARENEVTVVGVSPTFSRFLGAPTVTTYLSELQTVTGTAGVDSAAMIAVTLEDGAEPEAVKADLEAQFPEYEVRTNEEQLEGVLAQQAVVITGAVSLVALAFVTGAMLTGSLLSLFVYQHREELSTLWALGVSRRTVGGLVVVQGFLLGLGGWLVGGALTVPLARLLNALVATVVGYEGLVVVSRTAIGASAVVAVGIGTTAALLAALRVPTDVE